MSKENLTTDPITLEVPRSNHGTAAKGQYKYEVRDADGVVYDSGEWKPNLILDCGLDKLADMPWAQTFQWAVVGTDTTPTVEKFEDTNLQVRFELDESGCPNLDPGHVKCFDKPYLPIKAIAIGGCREAPMEPYWDDPFNNKLAPNVPDFAVEEARSFGRVTDIGKTLYLRDKNLQFQVLSSCPQYTVTPSQASGLVQAVSGACSTLAGAGSWPEQYNKGTPNAVDNGLTLDPGMGYLSGGVFPMNIGPGDPAQPLVFSNGTLNPAAGIRVSPPGGTGAKAAFDVTPKTTTTGLCAADISIQDGGDGYGFSSACPQNGLAAVNIPAPATHGHLAVWYNSHGRNHWGDAHIRSDNDDKTNTTSNQYSSQSFQATHNGYERSSFHSLLDSANWDYIWGNGTGGTLGYSNDYTTLVAQVIFTTLFAQSYVGNQADHDSGNSNGFANHFTRHYWNSSSFHTQPDTNPYYANARTVRTTAMASIPECLTADLITSWQATHDKVIDNWDTATKLEAAITANGISLLPLKQVVAVLDTEGKKDVTIDISDLTGNVDNWTINTRSTTGYDRVKNQVYKNGVITQGELEPNEEYSITSASGYTDYGTIIFPDTGSGGTYRKNTGHFYSNHQAPVTEIAKLVTDGTGKVVGLKFNPYAYFSQYWNSLLTGHQARSIFNGTTSTGLLAWRRLPGGYMTTDTAGAGTQKPAKAILTLDKCKVVGVTITDTGRGYMRGEKGNISISAPVLKTATVAARVDSTTGSVSAITVVDPGAGYSCSQAIKITFPAPPPQQIKAFDLLVQPVNTYENVNNDFDYKSIGLPFEGEVDIYSTDQTYLGQGKKDLNPGHLSIDGQGGYENRGDKYGPCHYFDPGLHNLEDKGAAAGHTDITHNQYKTHGWYVTGTDFETNSVYCGTDWLSSGNQVSLTRTFDFYMELQPVTYSEVGFKEAPAARELFSRIVLDDPIRLRAGQYLRLAYQLLVTLEPGPTARYREVPSEGTWFNGTRIWDDQNTGTSSTINILSGYECIQGNGIAIVDEYGIAIPYDITGVANEPYAPGSYFLGPQYGYVNRWKNGDTRLSFPTREYNNDINNPWVLGGDQHVPPDYAIKYFDNPTGNYRSRDFGTFLEWPQYRSDIVDYVNTSPGDPQFNTHDFPPGPEMTFERDSFVHFHTASFPSNTSQGSITWTNFVADKQNNKGRWDYHSTKPYVREVYPKLMGEPHVIENPAVSDAWVEKYGRGHLLAQSGDTEIRSFPGVHMGPVIPYDGDVGGLIDPTTISTTQKNAISHTGGAGMINRANFLGRNPYTGKVLEMLEPNNTGFSGAMYIKMVPAGCVGALETYVTPLNHWCYRQNVDPTKDDHAMGPLGLIKRATDYHLTSIKYYSKYSSSLHQSYGGGFSTHDSWKTWSHTPLIDHTKGLTINTGTNVSPDTAGNWSQAEAIPVAGASAFISTSSARFAVLPEWFNRSHTLYGAVSGHVWTNSGGVSGNPEHDFDGTKSIIEQQAGRITSQQKVNDGDRCFETPLMLNDYERGDHKRSKYAEWETTFGNLTGVKCIGVGPTSTTLDPIEMTDAARFNTYVFRFAGDLVNGLPHDNLTTFKLKTTFQHTWYRDLT
tara:strand:+ start:1347 stop:6146 length:4800 start_codon:yes stop_codon:yes gene_type:complete